MNITQDEFSSSYVKKNQLAMIGLSLHHTKKEKIYAVKCDICSKDPELFGDGIFFINKARLVAGSLPCGCSKAPKLSLEQHTIRAERSLNEDGYSILSVGEWNGNKTLVTAFCEKHGAYETSFDKIKCGYRCSKCAHEKISSIKSISEDAMIERCDRLGLEFVSKSERKDANGSKSFSIVKCKKCSHDEYVAAGLCDGLFESLNHEIAKGKMPCRCSGAKPLTYEQMRHKLSEATKRDGIYKFKGIDRDDYEKNKTMARVIRVCSEHGEFSNAISNVVKNSSGCPMCNGGNQKQAYINIVSIDGVDVAAKFGIAVNYKNRIHAQNRYSATVRNVCVFEFKSVEDCRAAERECKRSFSRGVVSKDDLQDGYTETVGLVNIEAMKKIFTSRGGVIVSGA